MTAVNTRINALLPVDGLRERELSPHDLEIGHVYLFKLDHWKSFQVRRVDFVGRSYIITNSESGDNEHCTCIDKENFIFKDI